MSKANPNQRRLDRHPAPDEHLDPDRRAEPSPQVDPLELMESAARIHWRAAAWLLERTRPEEYGRKSASAAPRRQVEAALLHVLEAALEGTLPEQRDAVDGRVFAACQRAFASCFPAVAALSPFELPGDPSPAGAILSPKMHEATEREGNEELNHAGTTSTTEDNAEPVSSPTNAAETFSASPADILSPKIAAATECLATEMPATEPPAILESPPETVPESQLLNLQRHAALRRRAALLSRKQQAATKRQKKAAKKRARAARKRAA
jgi:hypothetical protein